MEMLKYIGLFAVLFGTLQPSEAFTWTQHQDLQVCAGDNVTLKWSLQLDDGETVVDIKWLYQAPGQENVTLAVFVDDEFLAQKDGLSFVPTEGLAIWSVEREDSGNYYVIVKLIGASCDSVLTAEQRVPLTVSDVPSSTSGGELKVTQREIKANGSDLLSAEHVPLQLECGHFIDLGHPAVKPLWTTPSGETVESSVYDGGCFVLTLSSPVQTGNYTCHLPSSRATSCLPEGSVLTGSASHYLDAKDVQLAFLKARQDQLISQVAEMKEHEMEQTKTLEDLKMMYRNLTSRLDDTSQQQEAEESQQSSAECVAGSVVEWQELDDYMMTVSVGPAGVWGLKENKGIYYREGTYGNPNNTGTHWSVVEGLLIQLDVGHNVVWGVNHGHILYFRYGISSSNPTGISWTSVGTGFTHVTVSPEGHVWAIDRNNRVYYREGSSNSNPEGSSWTIVAGRMTQISAGRSGVWAVNSHDKVFYRTGTFGDNGSKGSKWEWVGDGIDLDYISSADGYVVGVNWDSMVYKREGVTTDNPTGTSWIKLSNRLNVIDGYGCNVAGASSRNEVFYGFL